MKFLSFKQQQWIRFWIRNYCEGHIELPELERHIYEEYKISNDQISFHKACDIAHTLVHEGFSEAAQLIAV